MRVRIGIPKDIDTDTMGAAIDAALEATTVSQVPLIASGVVPDIRNAIEQGRVRWKPEPPGDEHFDDARTVLVRGWGDCDDLAPWHAAGLRASGEDPGAQAFVYRSAPRRWHAVVQRTDGSIDDPSQWAGMRRGNTRGVIGAGAPIVAPMWPGHLGLAAYPFQGGWGGRVDIPDTQWPVSWSALSTGLTPAHAVVGAIRGACNVASVAGQPHPLDLARCFGIDGLLCGLDPEVVGEMLGDVEVIGEDGVGFLPLLAGALPAAGGILSSVMPGLGGLFGGGAKPAAAPPPAAAPAPMPGFSGGGGGGGWGGPIIIRF